MLTKGIAVYMRISLEDVDKRTNLQKDESNSISSQRKLICNYISKDTSLRGKEIFEFCDDGCTGTNFAGVR